MRIIGTGRSKFISGGRKFTEFLLTITIYLKEECQLRGDYKKSQEPVLMNLGTKQGTQVML